MSRDWSKLILLSYFAFSATGLTLLSTQPIAYGQLPISENLQVPGEQVAAPKIALDRYCPVDLNDKIKWTLGQPTITAVYDERVYHFASDLNKQAFLAAPGNYIPVLGGDCAMTFATSGNRVLGDINFGVLHKGRFYFFDSAETKQAFLADPLKYENVDLALDGKCVVCKVSLGQDVAGSEQFAAYHKGLQYLFPGTEQQQAFLADPDKFLKPKPTPAPNPDPAPAPELPVAFGGFCPVSLNQVNRWVPGIDSVHETFDGQRYYFPSEKERNAFQANPLKFVPVLGGDCVVTLVDGGKRVVGLVKFATYFRDRLYLFASAEEKSKFKEEAKKYADADLALGGNCPVCQVKRGVQESGKPEFEYLHKGLRYRFPSAQELELFKQDPAAIIDALNAGS